MSGARRGGLADDVVAHIRSQILSGDLKPGTKIDQDAIATDLEVSRSPIREAIVVLGQEGLLDVTPRRGAFVAQLTREDVIDHYELFGIISGRVAARAAVELDDHQLEELRSIHARFVAAPDDQHSNINHEFHQLINSAASRRTRWLLRHLARSIPAGFYGMTPGWDSTAVEGHSAIVEAIVNRQPDTARATMEEHLHKAGVAAADALQERGFWEETT